MTSQAYQCQRCARAYGMAGPIRRNCHTAQYCHLLAQILTRLLLPTGARSSAHLLPWNRSPIGSPSKTRLGSPSKTRLGSPSKTRLLLPTGATRRLHLARERRLHLAAAIGATKLFSARCKELSARGCLAQRAKGLARDARNLASSTRC